MITLVRLERNLLEGLELRFPDGVDFLREHSRWRSGGVDTAGLDGNDDMALVLEEEVGVSGDDTCLIRLGNICEDGVDLGEQHAVFLWEARVFNDGCDTDQYCGLLGFKKYNVRMTFVRFFAMLIKSRPDLGENSTA